jgi:hypothetical protein
MGMPQSLTSVLNRGVDIYHSELQMTSDQIQDKHLKFDQNRKKLHSNNSKSRCKTAKSGRESRKSGSTRFIKDNLDKNDMDLFYKNGYILDQSKSKVSTRHGTLQSTIHPGKPYNY